ncbi:MAG: SDR family NAD(P)-dependent oxidoreductase [Candidatus Nealsonbacteria bacterium]|nr:SDR family NAD(P)-dependent oxidoreductase [Candidatus Nealsonbacteria bacterium]
MPNSEQIPPAVVITGASTGIGAACAVELDRRGFRVFAGVRKDDDGARLRQQTSERLVPVLLDVTDAEAIAAAARQVASVVGDAGLAGLVNNAGIVAAGPLELVPIDKLRLQFEVNVIGQIAVTQALLPLLRTARGRVVNMSSISGRLASPYLGPYASSKFALEALSDSLRLELRNFGIRVSIVEPASIDTPIWKKSREAADQGGKNIPPELMELYQADLDSMRAATQQIAEKALPVKLVVRAVVHALSARRPKIRYPVGGQVRMADFASRFLPARLRDWIVRRELRLP